MDAYFNALLGISAKNVGGLARHVYDLSKELADQGEEIFLITCAEDGSSS